MKGSLFLVQLRGIIGEGPFWSTMTRYKNEWSFKHPTPKDFLRIAEKESGMILDWYLNLWISTNKYPDIAIESAYGVDNLHIDIDGPEVPIMDGSAAPFAAIIEEAGLHRHPQSRKFLAIRQPVSVIDGEKRVSIIPSRFFRITFDIAFQHPCIALQQRSVKVTPAGFRRDLAPARTFGFLRDVEMLKSAGLARGGSLENAIVVDDERILNPEGLRFQDEFVRHKILDAIGDLSLIGYPILGHVRAFKAGHDVNHQLVQKILANPENWQILEFGEDDLEKSLQMAPQTFATDLAFSKA